MTVSSVSPSSTAAHYDVAWSVLDPHRTRLHPANWAPLFQAAASHLNDENHPRSPCVSSTDVRDVSAKISFSLAVMETES